MKRQAKYRNKRIVVDGERFDSKREYARWCELKLLERAGEISELKRQVRYELAPSVKFLGATRAQPSLRLIVDFQYIEKGSLVLEDVKSPATVTATFTAKRHMLLAQRGLQVRIVQ
jgi:Fe2+ transport system protein B